MPSVFGLLGQLLAVKKLKKRAKILEKFILLAMKCIELNNFNGTISILSGLANTAVYGLKSTWVDISPKSLESFDELEPLMANTGNWAYYRQKLKATQPPLIPYLGVFLTDLTFIEDGNPNCIPDTKLINFSKRKKVAEAIGKLLQFQGTPYVLGPLPEYQGYLSLISKMHNSGMESQAKLLYEESLKCEPKVSNA